MEKIIELLNDAIKNGLDFQGNDIIKIKYYSETDIRAYYDKTARAYYNITYEDIISKRAGFIKWLVDNDKIDLLQLTCMNPRYTEILDSDFSWEDIIIMILSIQDKPIEFLISVLK